MPNYLTTRVTTVPDIMNIISRLVPLIAAGLLLALSACGGGDDDASGDTPPAPPAQSGIGAAGGTVSGSNGSKVEIPAGALSANTEIKILPSSAGAPTLPGGFTAVGQMFAFTPHGTTFAVPATMTIPFDPASVPAGSAPQFYKTNAQNQWEQVANATFGATSVSAQVTSFSDVTVVIPPLVRLQPTRAWQFTTRSDDGLEALVPGLDGSGIVPVGALLEKVAPFGPAFDATLVLHDGTVLPSDGVANGLVFSTADGVTYAVAAEAPAARRGTADPNGGSTLFTQTQSFIKQASNAKLKFTVTNVIIKVIDYGSGAANAPGAEELRLQGQVLLSIKAYKTSNAPAFFNATGLASMRQQGDAFIPAAEDTGKNHLWSLNVPNQADSFDVITEVLPAPEDRSTCGEVHHFLQLKAPITILVDLSSVGLLEKFTVETAAIADSLNRKGGLVIGDCAGGYVFTALRDPLGIEGTTIIFEGLEPTDNPALAPTDQMFTEPASCVPGPGPDPASGVLQFNAASYTVDELASAVPTITVTRTGGSSGSVTATFATSDGTAVGGTDYTPVKATVFFGDGEAGQRVVSVPIIPDTGDEAEETVDLTLSQPGGCAGLGTQTTAVLAIRDNDAAVPPPPGSSGALDPGFGSDGRASTTAFGGDRSAMALQADGKIVIVGGTFTDFILARFNADGSPDATFDADGMVTTDMVNGEQEEALGVAIQADGKIVVVGYTGAPGPGGPASFALARYNANGSLDTGFGSGGKIVSGVLGKAYAVAIQSDGKIVVAGEVDISSGADFANFVVARYSTNGTLDASFGLGGQLTTDIGGGTNSGRNIVLQANGAIVVSGEPFGTFAGSDHTDVVRYNLDGSPDSTFGSGGKLTLSGARVGEGLALQGDGKFVLAGVVDVSVPPGIPGTVTEFAVRRLNIDGSPDATFGSGGAASTTISGQRDAAQAVALQDDGKIVLVGRSSSIIENFAVARFNSNGSLDTGFGGNGGGKLTIDFFGSTDIAESVAIQPDGKIVLGGLARDNVDGYGVARINP